MNDYFYAVLVFVAFAIISGALHEFGHYSVCNMLYESEKCELVFGFCESVWPICVWHPSSIIVETAGGVFSGLILLAIYSIYRRLFKEKYPLKLFGIHVISLTLLVLSFMQIAQGLEEGLLPSVYENQLSIWNIAIMTVAPVVGALCYFWLNKE